VLTIVGDPDAVMHSCHVDDCADAYVALAEHPDRNAIANHAYNISNHHYETAREIGEALARSYGLGLTFEAPDHDGAIGDAARLFNFWQWVGSDKIRSATRWHEKRAAFVDGIDQYRAAFEANRPPARL
jgi:nucleoside-diphosphate-sugar epimerase